MIDFDKMFEEYALEYYNRHGDDFAEPEDMEDKLPEIYEEWANTENPALGGLAPRRFFENITDPEKLAGILAGSCEGDDNPCSLLLDRIVEVGECAPLLTDMVRTSENGKLVMIAMNLLTEMNAAVPVELYLDVLKDTGREEEVRELAVEALMGRADEAAESLYAMLDGASYEMKDIIADILVNAKKDERTYNLLTELFLTGENVPLHAGYLGKYGDERACEILYPALDDCNYLEFIEIKNAIERMGGTVDDEYRNFEDDAYYKALKNID